ncbi:guanine nucleotide-releasing factor 2 isoform X2 [Diabrotica virgifera virgifera]|uniref:Guanine nucleotide-releasing factor 2 n=1 Tax=Diabrotica virgifera virgifera TaxID=50390 RepID=A0ABM5K9P1_DIAVI|nr:guanine nucleotide-releasing factor 2 isoform X2 [Diabrotica virgifera virgifera]
MSSLGDIIREPSRRRRKYRVHGSKSLDYRCSRQWMVLLSISKLEDVPENESSPSPLAGPGPGGHKASFKSANKLARRARSFKDDFLGKISQMRSPVGVGGAQSVTLRSQSPKGPKTVDSPEPRFIVNKGPVEELDDLWKQIQVALKHFRDVVSKQKLEMLPGNGTIVLDTVWLINLAVKSSVESTNSVKSATLRMYQSVARLIKLCDDVLIDDTSSELDKENVNEIVQQVEDAVKDIINLVREKVSHQHVSYKTTPRSSYCNSLEMPAQRNSLPDIPLTPREREILDKKSLAQNKVRNSHSTESILRDPSPPPKPPLPENLRKSEPNNCITPPPLPPKKKHLKMQQLMDECMFVDHSPSSNSFERISLRSKSPDDSISILSESAGSIDSMLNHSSRDEDEIKDLMDRDDMFFENHSSDIFGANGSNSWEESSLSSSLSNHNSNGDHLTSVNDYHRLSNTDSGIVSIRSSSYSRSSQMSSSSSQYTQVSKQSSTQNKSVKTETTLQKSMKIQESQLKTTSHTVSTSTSNSMLSNSASRDVVDFSDVDIPPALPQKTKKKTERHPSPYDNVPEEKIGELLITCERHQSHQSLSSCTSSTTNNWDQDAKPPPLPPKKKHIMAYMEMFGNCSHTNDQEFMRHSVHMVQYTQPMAGGLPTTQSCTFSQSHASNRTSHSHIQTLSLPPRSDDRSPSPLHSPNPITSTSNTSSLPPALPPKQRRRHSTRSPPPTPSSISESKIPSAGIKVLPDLLEHTTKSEEKSSESSTPSCEEDLLELLNVDQYLVWKKEDEEGPDIRGGPIDALIIQATKATKNGVFMYQEAFLTTYRTFISPNDLITKLIRRYNIFYYQQDKKPRSREAFALIVRVVSDLTSLDLAEDLQQKLMNFVQQLISCGELTLAKALRVKHLQRHEAKQQYMKYTNVVTSLSLHNRNSMLLDFKSEQIAEQMTLLDAELFMKIEIPEVLIWAQEQNEERSPNLTRFTEHFNKMSYWARTKILTAEGKDTREKYFSKFIKIMKHLRKINNFNSYLALLSALDSAPVRRLEWQKQVQEGLKEYCALIDSSSSFRAYRMALAETQPPCIPYIGLVLQDLTFVHIGNSNLLPDGSINFSKRWQQFNIVENMKKFKKATYTFKKQEKIITFFQNFDDFIGEDAMWKLSETIKPRGKKMHH